MSTIRRDLQLILMECSPASYVIGKGMLLILPRLYSHEDLGVVACEGR